MVEDLDAASLQSADPPSAPPLLAAHRAGSGKRGRPKVVIDRTFLSQALTMRGPTGIASVLGCSSRTIRRRALEYQLVEPGPPVMITAAQEDGTVVRTWTDARTARADDLTDNQLDSVVRQTLEVIPLSSLSSDTHQPLSS